MTKEEILRRIRAVGIIPAIHAGAAEEAKFAVEAISSAGIPIVEITMTVQGALDVIADLSRGNPELIIGAGTVLDVDTAKQSMRAGARFITSPSLKESVMREVQQRGIVAIPGAMTPTEVSAAWELGVDFVKIFPCSALGGPNYIRALKRPFAKVPLIAAGGVNQQNAADFILYGADVIGIGAGLVSAESLSHHESKRIRELARRFVSSIGKAREQAMGNGIR